MTKDIVSLVKKTENPRSQKKTIKCTKNDRNEKKVGHGLNGITIAGIEAKIILKKEVTLNVVLNPNSLSKNK